MPDLGEMGSGHGKYRERGARISAAMKRKGLTQTALAKALSVQQPTLNEILRGDTPGTKHLKRMAQLLDCEVEWITSGHGSTDDRWQEKVAAKEADLATLLAQIRERDARIRRLEAENEQLRGRAGADPGKPSGS